MPLEPSETAILLIRIHPLFLVLELLMTYVASFMVFAILALAAIVVGILPQPLFAILTILWFLTALSLLLVSLYRYFFTFWQLTSLRVILQQQKAIFWRTVDECRLDQVQDVTTDKPNIFAAIFDYGTLNLQTAGTIPKFTLSGAANPEQGRESIMNAVRALANQPKPVYTVPAPTAPSNLPV